MGKNEKVDDYISNSPAFARPILEHLRALVFATDSSLTEEIKWGFPCYSYEKKLVCSMSAHKAHCTFSFWLGNDLPDPYGILERIGKTNMGSIGKINSLNALPKDEWLAIYLHDAIKLAQSGATKKSIALPKAIFWSKDFPELFNGFEKQSTAFNQLSPSHRREYIEWIMEAKTDKTKSKRVATMMEWLSKGKSRNWKYEK